MISTVFLSIVLVTPHATFRGNEAKALFRNQLPTLITNRIINQEFNGHLSKVIALLKQDNVFMVCSAENDNMFVCSDHGSTHVVEAVVYENREDALMKLQDWHEAHFRNVSLELA